MKEPQYQILYIENNKKDQNTFKRIVKERNLPYEYSLCETIEDACQYLNSLKFDIIVSVHDLSDGNALDLFDLKMDIPLIVLIAEGKEESAIKALKKGAIDYIIKDEQGSHFKILPIILEQEIKHSQAIKNYKMFSHAIKWISDSVYITDKDDRIIYVNYAFLNSYEYNPSDIIGKKSEILWKDKEIKQEIKDLLYKSPDNGFFGEFFHLRKDGSSFPISLSQSIIKDDYGKDLAIIGISRDITRNKLLEEKLRESESNLRQRTEIIERELKYAQLVQNSLLPKELPNFDWLKIDYRYIPYDAVGGDYFSLTPLQEGGLGVFVGDVSGHGVSAALFLSLVKSASDRACRKFGHSPIEYIKALNQELLGNMPSYFITAIYGYFLPNSSSIVDFTFAKGGHPPPLFYNKQSNQVSILDTRGSIVGIFENIKIEILTSQAQKGDRFFLYTDGLPEAMNEKREMIGFEQLARIVEQASVPSLEQTLDNIINTVKGEEAHYILNDDVVLIGFEIL